MKNLIAACTAAATMLVNLSAYDFNSDYKTFYGFVVEANNNSAYVVDAHGDSWAVDDVDLKADDDVIITIKENNPELLHDDEIISIYKKVF